MASGSLDVSVRTWTSADRYLVAEWAGEEDWAITKLDLHATYYIFKEDTFCLEMDGEVVGTWMKIHPNVHIHINTLFYNTLTYTLSHTPTDT